MNPLALLQAIRAHVAGGAPSGPPGPGGAGLPGAGGPPQAPPSAPPQGGGDPRPLISHMIQLGVQALGAMKDPVEKADLSKILAQLHTFAANEQKERDAALGSGPAVKLVRRASQGSNGAY